MRLAVVNLAWLRRMAPFPEIVVELTRRVILRARRVTSMLAITQQRPLEWRLRLCLWELADRYGRVGVDGVRLDLNLTQGLLGHLVGSHRPSVSTALSNLERDGYLRRRDGALVLLDSAPALDELAGEPASPAPAPADAPLGGG